jgi:uncharacterized membrane protein
MIPSNNTFRKAIASLAAFFMTLSAQAQRPEVEMADTFRSEGKIYVVVAVALIIFLGMVVYLISIDRKVKKLEEEQNN